MKQAPQTKRGDSSVNGQASVVLTIQKQPQADTRVVTQGINEALEELRGSLPSDVVRHIAVMTTAFAAGQIIGPLLASAWFAVSQSFSGALVVTSSILLMSALALLRTSSQSQHAIQRS